MNRRIFEVWVETRLAPTLKPGDMVILDNLSRHNSEKAAAILKERGAWFLFLPPYSPDLNPIKMAFSKLKAHRRKAKARIIDALWHPARSICDLYSPDECRNDPNHAGYVADQRLDALRPRCKLFDTPKLAEQRGAYSARPPFHQSVPLGEHGRRWSILLIEHINLSHRSLFSVRNLNWPSRIGRRQIEAIGVHDLSPSGDEIPCELFLVALFRVDLGRRAQLAV